MSEDVVPRSCTKRLTGRSGSSYLSPPDVLLFRVILHLNQTLIQMQTVQCLSFEQEQEQNTQTHKNTHTQISLPTSPSPCNVLLMFPAFQTMEGSIESSRAHSAVKCPCTMLLCHMLGSTRKCPEQRSTRMLRLGGQGGEGARTGLSPRVLSTPDPCLLSVLSRMHLTSPGESPKRPSFVCPILNNVALLYTGLIKH